MNRTLRNLTAATLALLVSATPAFAGRSVSASSRTSVNTNVNRNTNVNHNTNVNVNHNTNVNVNHNVNVDRDIDVDVHHGHIDHPAAVAVGAAVVTGLVIGAIVNSLPRNCTVVVVNGVTYQHCDNTWYQPRFAGTTTTYIVVAAPK